MTEAQRKLAAALVLLLLAAPSGLCSLIFLPTGLGMAVGRDALEQSVGWVMIGTSVVGWLFSALMIWMARMIRRPVAPKRGGREP